MRHWIQNRAPFSVARLWMAAFAGIVLAASAQAQSAPDLSVGEALIATGVENLEPLGAGETFDAGVEQLYAFTRIQGAQQDTVVKHLWFRGDELLAEVELPVRSVNWRTYSSKNILPGWTGQWRVDVTDETGTVLTSIPFTIGETMP